ncbi:MAG: hypothetical protein A3B86_01110 [Candidatus Yanofskybacteria bacterium RIFCSPHIGHO2_02_FULL_38_22b]|uniref:Cell shape-determining protein MreC n=1 Tax=Candidatus Yanofskybacteria bacterium RIFCSPHIGHO2_02_FULL_38_22b TaxID=1802673 RepID=A0A1F8F2I8_9BACT|nr:MAG: hypothetical protein A3B86_01110 [Candidatus Yanofskybacteria bacterium RIFCSPHIGHO2_02_FULL_38_22b]OGN20392.1 MAG: hypothetical protein A2910_01460 [Candidatus Yanofskybacteria bacterium RIFCSPLOWO2_01_FULL_39_28]
MKSLKLWSLFFIFLIVALLVFFIFLGSFRLGDYSASIKNIRVSFFSKINVFSSFLSKIERISKLTKENMFLKNENTKLLSLLASQDELQDQINFLRESLDLDIFSGHKFIDARIFNFQFTPEGHHFLINKGGESGIKIGDIIVVSTGILLGVVDNVDEGFSRASLITNSGSKITVKVLGKNTTGIARGFLNEGLRLDFISQNDQIVEGDTIITNGNDMFPPGLLIGKVSNIIFADDGDLFKKVILEPEFKKINLDRVLILTQ